MLKVKVTSSMKMIMVMKMEMLKILTSSLSRSPEDKCVYRNLPWIFSHWVPFPDPGPPSRINIGKKVIINLLFSLWYHEIGWNRLKFRVLRAKRGTGLKKIHHQRWWRWWLIWGMYYYHAPEKERSSLWWISRLLKWNSWQNLKENQPVMRQMLTKCRQSGCFHLVFLEASDVDLRKAVKLK